MVSVKYIIFGAYKKGNKIYLKTYPEKDISFDENNFIKAFYIIRKRLQWRGIKISQVSRMSIDEQLELFNKLLENNPKRVVDREIDAKETAKIIDEIMMNLGYEKIEDRFFIDTALEKIKIYLTFEPKKQKITATTLGFLDGRWFLWYSRKQLLWRSFSAKKTNSIKKSLIGILHYIMDSIDYVKNEDPIVSINDIINASYWFDTSRTLMDFLRLNFTTAKPALEATGTLLSIRDNWQMSKKIRKTLTKLASYCYLYRWEKT